MFPFSVHDQLPQNKYQGFLVAFAQGVWGQMEDGSEGFVFPGEGNTFTWAHDENYLQTEKGVTEEALMDCVEQIEAELGSPKDIRQRYGLMKGGGQAYVGVAVTSRVDPRIVCNFTPTSNYPTQAPVEGYFEWYVRDQADTVLDTEDFLSYFEKRAGIDPQAGGDMTPTALPDYEEACQHLGRLTISESRKQSFLQRLWDLRSTARGYQEQVQRELMKEWKAMAWPPRITESNDVIARNVMQLYSAGEKRDWDMSDVDDIIDKYLDMDASGHGLDGKIKQMDPQQAQQMWHQIEKAKKDLENQFDPDEIEVGDYVDFGGYGKLYVCHVDEGGRSRVTNREKDRFNPDASGWYINLNQAEGIIEPGADLDPDDYEDDEE